MCLDSWKLKQPRSPSVPHLRPLYSASHAWQASSITASLCFLAMALIGSMSHGMPKMWTGMMARVRSVIRLSIGRRIHRQRGRVGVGKHRQGLAGQDGVVGGDERVGRDDHLVAGVHVHDVQADHQRRGAAGGGQAALGAEQLRVAGLELLHVRVGAAEPLAAAQDLEDVRLPGLRHTGQGCQPPL